jgi:hypothetical protein
MPDVLDLKADLPSLEEAKFVSFPTLQLDITKIETGYKILVKLRDDLKKALEGGENPSIGCTQEIFQRVSRYEEEIASVLAAMNEDMIRAQSAHSELCVFLGEDVKQDPEGLYGQLLSFVSSLEAVIARKLKRL